MCNETKKNDRFISCPKKCKKFNSISIILLLSDTEKSKHPNIFDSESVHSCHQKLFNPIRNVLFGSKCIIIVILLYKKNTILSYTILYQYTA